MDRNPKKKKQKQTKKKNETKMCAPTIAQELCGARAGQNEYAWA